MLAAIVGGSLFLLLLQAGFSVESWNAAAGRSGERCRWSIGKTSTPIGLALTGVRVDQLDEPNERLRRGMSGYLFPFVIISMHLLVVLIGASYMARTKRLASGARRRASGAAAIAPRTRRRSLAVMGGIVSGIIVNLVLGLLWLAYWLRAGCQRLGPAADGGNSSARLDLFPEPAADWLCPLLGVLFLANVLCCSVDLWLAAVGRRSAWSS